MLLTATMGDLKAIQQCTLQDGFDAGSACNKNRRHMQPNYRTSIKFLLEFHPARRWVLTAIEPRRIEGPNRIATATFDEARYIEAMEWLQKHGDLHYGLYFTVNPPDKDFPIKPKKADIPQAFYLHVDCDPKAGKEPTSEQNNYIGLLQKFNPGPSVIVKSGNGIHGYWRLNTPCSTQQAEAANKILEKTFTGGTQTFNVDRIMRLPGTINYPNAVKQAKGYSESISEVMELNLDREYSIDDFNTVAPMIVKPKKAKVEKVIDRSAIFFKWVAQLIKAGLTDEEITARVFDPTEPKGERVRERSDAVAYVARELFRVHSKTSSEATKAYKLEKNEKWPGGMTKEGDPRASRVNLEFGIAEYHASVYFDSFTDHTMLCGVRGFPPVCRLEDYPRNRLKIDIEETGGPQYEEQRFNQMLEDIAHDNKRNPVIEYLDSLKWDEKPRLNTWLSDYCGAEDTAYSRAVGRIHLIAGVRRIKSPGCKYDTMLIFISPQGFSKSTAIEVLAKNTDWFAGDLNLNSDPKQLIENLHGKWIVECAEMKGNSKAEVSTVKGLLSRTHDTARMSYDRFPKTAPRKSIFFGSTNDRKFLYDPTGARRFWPVDVKPIKIHELRADVDQLWAEAVAAEANGESITLDSDLWAVAGIEQERATLDNAFYEKVEALLGGYAGKIQPEDLWNALGYADLRGRGQQQALWLVQTMQKLGWEKKPIKWKTKTIRGWAKGYTGIMLTFAQDQRGKWRVDETPSVFDPMTPEDS
jgi:hypothetical protein